MYDLSGNIAIVTGAGGKRGLGRSIAIRLAREGADVIVIDKYRIPPRDKEISEGWKGIDSVYDEIIALGRNAMALTCDITQSREVDQMVQAVVSKFGKVDILVNNAGIDIYASILDMSDELWATHLNVNLTGTFYCSRAVARDMIRRKAGGRIINIASMLGKTGMGDFQSAYCASKFGVIGFTQSMALELASYRILVNAICPMLTETGIHDENCKNIAEKENISFEEANKRIHDSVRAQVPLGRLGEPEDIANMVAFLSSSEASFITGQSINVNGGKFTAH